MIEEALEQNESKQPRPNCEIGGNFVDLPSWLEISPQKVLGDEERLGCFLMVYIISYWMKGFVFQLLLDIFQIDIKPP